jgi:hypothetical protein
LDNRQLNKDQLDVSVVIPLLNEDESLAELHGWIVDIVKSIICPMRLFLWTMEVLTILAGDRRPSQRIQTSGDKIQAELRQIGSTE